MLGSEPQRRYAVITPYYREDRATLERCLASVAAQTIPADHILVADGFPQDWLEAAGVRHIRLDRAHGDYGNLARGLGAQLAIAEKYDAIAFLDADNVYRDEHLEMCLAAAREAPRAPYVIAQRDYVRPDGSTMPLGRSEDFPDGDHVDTNCYLFLPPAYPLLHHWCTLPREFSAVGDRLFRQLLKARLPAPALTARKTVAYTCLFEGLYRALGEAPPPGAKPGVDWRPALAWLEARAAEELPLIDELSGVALSRLVRRAA